MRNMSFYKTIWQFIRQIKTVTRRQGWPNLRADDVVMGIEKGQGLKKGQKIRRLGEFRVLDERWERIDRLISEPEYGRGEVIREGFPEMTPQEFVDMYCKMNRCKPSELCHRFSFEYVVKRTAYSILDGRPCPNLLCENGNISVRDTLDCGLLYGVETGASHGDCPNCDGYGGVEFEWHDTCPFCGGAGVVDEPVVPIGENQMRLI
jgi:hypothetical protein